MRLQMSQLSTQAIRADLEHVNNERKTSSSNVLTYLVHGSVSYTVELQTTKPNFRLAVGPGRGDRIPLAHSFGQSTYSRAHQPLSHLWRSHILGCKNPSSRKFCPVNSDPAKITDHFVITTSTPRQPPIAAINT